VGICSIKEKRRVSIMKIFKLTSFWESEFKPDPDFDYTEVFKKHKLFDGRMVGGSKSGYRGQNPDNIVVFNANIVTKAAGKIWYGDLDVTKDFDSLKEVADEIKQDLYILTEHDARFENEDAGFKYWKEKAVTVILADCKCK
jgi:hypothetical protein